MTRSARPRISSFTWHVGILLYLLVSVSYGGTIRLKNGKEIEGNVVRVTADVVMIDRGGVEIQLARAQIIEPDCESLVSQARQAGAKGDHEAAAALCGQVLVWQPNREDAAALLAQSEVALKALQEQEKARIQAAAKERAAEERREKDLAEAQRLIREKNPLEAAAILERILEEKPDHAVAGRLLAGIRSAEQAAQRQNKETKRKVEAAGQREEEALRKAREEAERAQRIQIPEYVQGAAREVEEKLKPIVDYVCTRTTVSQTPSGPVVAMETIGFKRPDFYASTLTYTQSPVPGQAGAVTMTRIESAAAWLFSKGGTGLGAPRPVAGDDGIRPEDDGDSIQGPPPTPTPVKPTINRYDRARLRQAGCDVEDILPPSFNLLKPFDLCDTTTLRLVRETDNDWVFSTKLAASQGGGMPLRIGVGRGDGVVTRVEVFDASNNPQSVIQFAGVHLNVGLKDEEFAFTPTNDIAVKDATQEAITVFAAQHPERVPIPTPAPTPEPSPTPNSPFVIPSASNPAS